ncbi:MAG: helix-turn-helix domain-containing protein [Alphaproteobacteria bacterium]|nr:helix-turn-helix domain-containing protein [Alphaproteobacteria bacterium]
MAELTIGKLAARTGVNIETIRYYERIGMIPPPPRSAGGQRRYEEGHLRRLSFVRRCRELGFPLDEIRALLALVDGGDYSCAEVRDMTVRQLDAVRRRIADLRVMERTLDTMAAACDGGSVPECPIVDALFAERK